MTPSPPGGLSLTAEEWRVVHGILADLVPDVTVTAFGSRVTGRAKPWSDLDLALTADAPLTLARLAALREAFSESSLPWKVDLVDTLAVSPEFQARIAKEQVLLQPGSA